MRDCGKLSGLKNLFLLLFVLSFSFAIISCGSGPMSKVGEPEIVVEAMDNGTWGLDFNLAPPNTGPANPDIPYGALGKSIDSLDILTGFTIEAWVYPRSGLPATPTGTVWGRGGDEEGIVFYFFNGKPFLYLKYSNRLPQTTPYLMAKDNTVVHPSNTWVHIAGVYTTQNHTVGPNAHATCADGDFRAAASHLDFYTNGVYKGCGPTEGRALPALDLYNEALGKSPSYGDSYACSSGSGPGCPTFMPHVHAKGNLVIDEVRIWETDRNATDINACKNNELGAVAPCDITNPTLLSYWKLDEGAGEIVITDSALHQNNGILTYCDQSCDAGGATFKEYDCAAINAVTPGICTDPWIDFAVTNPPGLHP